MVFDCWMVNHRLPSGPVVMARGFCVTVAVTGGQFERYVNAGPAVMVDGGTAITLTAFHARPRPGATEVIKMLAPPANKVLLLNGYKDQADVPWTTSTRDLSILP